MANKNRQAKETTNTIVNMVIVAMIAVGIVLLNFVTIAKIKDYDEAIKDAMFIQDDLPVINDDTALAEVMRYQSDTYNMIEVYDEHMTLMMSVQFGDEINHFPTGNITDYPELMDQLKTNQNGKFIIEPGDDVSKEEISFNWLTNCQGEKRLIVIYSMMPLVKDVWVISTICYAILILVLVLMLKFLLHRYSDRISMYKYLSIL